MQEDKKRTTPPGEKGGTRRRRNRKKGTTRPSQKGEKVVTGAAETSPETLETPAQMTGAQPTPAEEKAAVPPQDETPAASEPEVDRQPETDTPQEETVWAEAEQAEPVPEETPAETEQPEVPEKTDKPEEVSEETEAKPVPETADGKEEAASPAQESVEDAAPDQEETPEKTVDEAPAAETAASETAQDTPETSVTPEEEKTVPEPVQEASEETASEEQAAAKEEAAAETAEAAPSGKASPEESAGEKTAEPAPEAAQATPEEAPASSSEATEPEQIKTEGQSDNLTEDSDADEAEEDEEELLPEEDEKRLSDLTRTVQLSVEQIMAQVSDETDALQTAGEETPAEDSGEAEEETADLEDPMRSGLSGMAKWLLLVVFFVLVIACCGVAWLYRNATPDMLPQITASFDGQTLEPTAYKWKVPVIGNVFKRTYADTFSSTAVALPETVDQVSPDFEISPSGYRSEVTVTDANDAVLFEGDTDSFSSFRFTANGTYTAKLVVHSDASSVPGDATVTGSETWLFSFTVEVRTSMHMSSSTVSQGSVAAIIVGDTLDGSAPALKTELENTGFYKANTGWVCYLPIPWNEPAGTKTVTVTAGGYTETLEFTVETTSWEYKDYYRESQRVSPYIGAGDLPKEVKELLDESDADIAWNSGNFVQPFLNTLNVKLAYGTTEYVGRSYSERSSNTGTGGRTATNVVLTTKSGESLIAPANGRVLLAKNLGGDYGYTLVIDHGAGVKSIFYNLKELNVKAGASVKQGQTLATCGTTTVAEMRIGTVPIDPVQVWRGQCDALKYY